MKKIVICLLAIILVGIFAARVTLEKSSVMRDDSLITNNKSLVKGALNSLLNENKQTLDVPLILQKPELSRGCEVTSLAMVLNYQGINVNKMELAQNIKYEPFEENNMMGNMNRGFVGDIHTFDNPGLGVYVDPIVELAKKYVTSDRVINLSNKDPEDLYDRVDDGLPVWVITNALFKEIPENNFETRNTVAGDMRVTYQQHSIVITGYDENYVYINDPLESEKNRAIDRVDFEKAWIQMGRQAMTIST